MLSKYCKKNGDKHEIKVGDVKKLIPNLGNKTNYVVHYRNLQLYLSLGMKLTKINKVLKFNQSDWMKKYIDFNTKKRMKTANDFEKDFLKLMINSVNEKTMENLRKRINVRLVNNKKDFLKYTSRPTCIGYKKCGKHYAVIHEIKPVLIRNKPIYIGSTLLDLSKWKMYDFHYNFIKKNFDAELLFTDTDSLTYEIKSNNVYKEVYKERWIWWSYYNWICWTKVKNVFNKKIDGKQHNTAKGVNIASDFDNFKDVLFNKKFLGIKWKEFKVKNIN